MNLYILTQRKYYDWFTPDAINSILVRANSEEEARQLCSTDEDENRDSSQSWDLENATCEILSVVGTSEVILAV